MKLFLILGFVFLSTACAHTEPNHRTDRDYRVPASTILGTERTATICGKGQFTTDAIARLNTNLSSTNVQALTLADSSGYATLSLTNFKSSGDIALSMEEELDYSTKGAKKKSPYYMACTLGKGTLVAVEPGNNISP